MLALVLGVALLLGGLAVSGTERATNDLLSRLTEQATERMRLSVVSHLQGPRQLSEMNANLIHTGNLDPNDVQSCISEFFAQLSAFTDISDVLICNNDMDTMWVERMEEGNVRVAIYQQGKNENKCVEWALDEKGRITGEPLGSYAYFPPARPWYVSAMSGKDGTSWTPLYIWASTNDVKPIGTGRTTVVRDPDGSRIAILEVGFTVEKLSEYLKGIEVSPNGRAFVIDASGRLVATDTSEAPASVGSSTVFAADSVHPVVSAAAKALLNNTGVVASQQNLETIRHTSVMIPNGEQYLVDSQHLNIEWGPDWKLVTAIPESDLLEGVRAVRNQMVIWGIVVLVVAGLAGLLLATSIVRPIVGLRKSAAQVTKGDLDAHFKGRGGLEFEALAADLDHMRQGLKDRLEMRNALAVAMEVQQHLLPDTVPENGSMDIAAFSTYCDETGGDYYDFPDSRPVEQIEDGSLLLAIGDVTGHGIAAALIMATARASIRTRLRHGGTLGTVLRDVNEVLAADIPGGRFMTLLAIILSPDGSSYRWSSAGHDPPLVYNIESEEFFEPEGGGVPLGIVDDAEYDEHVADFGPVNSIMVLGTDGIWETADQAGDLYGKDRLRDVIRTHSAESSDAIGKAIIEDLNMYRGSDRPLDDVTLIVIKRR